MRGEPKRAIWERCLLAAIASGKPAKAAAAIADDALREYALRFAAEIAAEEAAWGKNFEPRGVTAKVPG